MAASKTVSMLDSAAPTKAAATNGGASGLVSPGQKLGDSKSYAAGAGTYELDGTIYASLCGIKTLVPATASAATATAAAAAPQKTSIEVRRDNSAHVIPSIGDSVTAKISKVNERFAACDILLVGGGGGGGGGGGLIVKEQFSGTIRKRDVRKFEVDSVELYRCFRPGDIIRAEVISLGDAKSYYLSTAKNELGVVLAQSTAGHIMVPISWEQMQCPVTAVKEFRKVAKVNTESG